MGLFVKLSKNAIQHNNTVIMLSAVMFSFTFNLLLIWMSLRCFAKWHYAECRYDECRYAECRYAECRYAECRYAECDYASVVALSLTRVPFKSLHLW